MPESVTLDRRQRRMVETATRLTAVSRRLTAQHGLNGFTIEQLCDEVGVSRRTFFNYFPSKEDAVIGADPADEFRRFAEEFLARGSRGWPVVIDDLLELAIQHFGDMEGTAEERKDLFAAVEREPRLLQRFIGANLERERQAVELVAAREAVDTTDARAQAVVRILFTLMRTAGERFDNRGGAAELAVILHESLDAARTVLAQHPRKAQS
jgi:AcrR family transcriptional regulator